MNIARVKNGLIVNIEVADQQWIDAQPVGEFEFIPYTEGDLVVVGDAYGPQVGFPPVPQPENP